MTTLERVSSVIEKGYENKLNHFLDTCERTLVLPKELQDKLSTLGTNPIEEPELYKIIVQSAEDGSKASIALHVLSEEEIVKFSGVDMGNFVYAVERRITDHRDENNVFKVTPNTEGCKIPNFLQSDELQRAGVRQAKILQGLKADAPEKVKAKVIKDYTAAVDSYAELCYKISGLDIELLSDWEKILVASIVTASATDAFQCATGKASGI